MFSIADYHKFSGLKQPKCNIILQFCRSEVEVDSASSLLQITHGQNQRVNCPRLLTSGFSGHWASKLTQTLGRIVSFGCRTEVPISWLAVNQKSLSAIWGRLCSLSYYPCIFHLATVVQSVMLWTAYFCRISFSFSLQFKKLFIFKGSYDLIMSTE